MLTTPFLAAGPYFGHDLLPGLPLAALAVVCPATAALLLTWRRGRMAAAWRLLGRLSDAGRVRPRAWWLAIIMVPCAIATASFLASRLLGSEVPDPQVSLAQAVTLLAMFMLAALAEELGWTAYALAPLQARWGATPAALLIGAAWALWHYPALLQVGRSADWIAWWTLGTVAQRVVMVWLFNRSGGSLMAVAVTHAMSNLCWQLYPVQGSWFDPGINGLVTAAVALLLLLAPWPAPRRGDEI